MQRTSFQSVQTDQALIVAMATRGTVAVETVTALTANTPGRVALLTAARQTVVDARNELAEATRKLAKQTGIGLALWVDDDAFWAGDTIARLLRIMQTTDIDMIVPLSSDRRPFCAPGQFRLIDGIPRPILPRGTRATEPVSELVWFTPGDVVEIDACSFHFVLMRTSLLDRVGSKPFTIPENSRFPEDLQFCFRAKNAGAKIACDTRSMVAHVEAETGQAFIPLSRPGRIERNAYVAVPDDRSEADILAEWDRKNIRANRSYGADVEPILQRMHETSVAERARAQQQANKK